MHQKPLKWLSLCSLGLLPFIAVPAFAHDDDHDSDHHHKHKKEVTVRTYRYEPYRTYTYRYGPDYRTYGYVEGDYTEPENAWWHNYEQMNAGRGAAVQGQIYGYTEPQEADTYTYYQGQPSYEAQATPTNIRVRGTIVELRQMRSGEFDRPQVLAFVDTGRGTERVVLGPVDQIRGTDIQPGDTITVIGTTRTIAGRTNLVANRFQTNYATWGTGSTGSNMGYTAAPETGWYYGQVKSDEHEKVGGITHTLARVELDNGDTVRVDLGPRDAIRDVDLDRGDRISVRGHWGRVKDGTGLIADEFQWQGRSFVLRDLDVDVHAYR